MVVRNTPTARAELREATRQAAACAELAALDVRHRHAAGIDVGDLTHWVCVDADGGNAAVREFPAHTPGLRDLVAWLRHGGVTTVALEATGVYSHVLFLTLLEAGFDVVAARGIATKTTSKGRTALERQGAAERRKGHLGRPKDVFTSLGAS